MDVSTSLSYCRNKFITIIVPTYAGLIINPMNTNVSIYKVRNNTINALVNPVVLENF